MQAGSGGEIKGSISSAIIMDDTIGGDSSDNLGDDSLNNGDSSLNGEDNNVAEG